MTCCWRHAAGAASASRSAMCGSSAAAPRPACAASGWPRGDQVISLSVLHHMDAETAEREAYLRYASAQRRAAGEEEGERRSWRDRRKPPARLDELRANEEFILTVTAKGYGKRSSAYEYRITGRGGQGIANIERSERNGDVVASFPVDDQDQIMLVTDGGQLIRCPVHDIRIAGPQDPGRGAVQGGRGRARRLRRPSRRGRGRGQRRGERPANDPEPRRRLSRHLRSHHQRPSRHHPPRRPSGRSPRHRRLDQCRQGAAVRRRRSRRHGRGGSRRLSICPTATAPSRSGPSTIC